MHTIKAIMVATLADIDLTCAAPSDDRMPESRPPHS
jgi:hypothetical protein